MTQTGAGPGPAAAGPAAAGGLMAGAPPFAPEARVTLANWQDPPFNRWAFQHVWSLIRTARIPPGTGRPWHFPRADRALAAIGLAAAARKRTTATLFAQTSPAGSVCLP